MIRLLVLTVLEILAFVWALVAFLTRISHALERIGGWPTSYLAKISFGVRAIEKETSHLGPQVMQLNRELDGLAHKLAAVDGQLAGVGRALAAGKEGQR